MNTSNHKVRYAAGAGAFFLLIVTLFSAWAFPVLAHQVRIFAYAEGGFIVGETAFSGGRVPKNAEIIVRDAAGSGILATCRTDGNGRFRFAVPEAARRDRLDLRIVVNGGEGHRGEWLLTADEYLAAGKSGAVNSGGREGATVVDGRSGPAGFLPGEERLRRIVEEAVDKKLGPVKEMLARNRNREAGFRDILGGIGYLVGIAGIIAYFRARAGREDQK